MYVYVIIIRNMLFFIQLSISHHASRIMHIAWIGHIVNLLKLIYKPMSGGGCVFALMFVITQWIIVTQFSTINKDYCIRYVFVERANQRSELTFQM